MAPAASDSVVWDRRNDRTALFAIAFILGSVAVHAIGFYFLDKYVKSRPPPVIQKPMELVMIDVKPPPPKEEPKKEEPPPPPPVKVKPPPVKVAKVKPIEIPKEETPPPPNEQPKEEPKKVVPVVVGISMSSTTANGAFAAPVGNTMYGKTADKAVKPEDVKPYSAPKYMPSYQVDSQPELTGEVKVPYPEEARKAEIEGTVLMKVTIDNEGKVVDVKLIKGLGYGLDEAAMGAMKRFKFKPAIKGGEAVSTTITYAYNFELP